MPARRAMSVCLPVGARWVVELRRYSARTPILSVQAGSPPALVTFTLPERVEPAHVEFARQLARHAALYAAEVERAWRGLPPLAEGHGPARRRFMTGHSQATGPADRACQEVAS
jgi:hypothetical protein